MKRAKKLKINQTDKPVFLYCGLKFFWVSFQTPAGFSPQCCNVKIVQLFKLVKPSLGRCWIRRDVVPKGDVRFISRSPRRVKLRVTRTWTCSKNFMIFDEMFIVSGSSDGMTLKLTRKVCLLSFSVFFFFYIRIGFKCEWGESHTLKYKTMSAKLISPQK